MRECYNAIMRECYNAIMRECMNEKKGKECKNVGYGLN